jgi:hypothetical protein
MGQAVGSLGLGTKDIKDAKVIASSLGLDREGKEDFIDTLN